jgi:PAS domain S-box-containing protein
LDIPLVVITDAVSLESAVEYMRHGVADCVTGDQIARLGPIAVREIYRRRHRPSMERERAALGILAHIVEQSPVAIAITDLHANIEYVNPKFTQLTGYTYDEAIGMPASRLAAGRPDTDLTSRIMDALAAAGEWRGQFHNRKKTGEAYWASASISTIRSAAGEANHLLAVYEDIADRVRVMDALRASEDRFHALIEASPLAIVGLDLDGIVRTWNPAAARIMGWTSEEAIGCPYLDLVVPADARDEHHALRERVMRGEGFTGVQARRQKKDGTFSDANLSTAPLRASGGQIVGVIVMIEDVTEHKQMGERLRQSEERFRRLIENASDLLSILNAESGTILYESPSAERILGYTPADMIGQSVFSYVHPDDLAQIGQVFGCISTCSSAASRRSAASMSAF